jgi:hypothetical protein
MDRAPADGDARDGDVVRPGVLALSLVLLAVAAAPAHADGTVAVASGDAGPFRIDVLAAPSPPRVGATQWSVVVRDLASGAPVTDAEVELALRPATATVSAVCGTPEPGSRIALGDASGGARSGARRTAAAKRVLHSARLELGAAGDWVGAVQVRRGELAGELAFRVEIAPVAPPLAAHARAFALPLLALSLFGLHQWRARGDPRKRPG